MEKTRNKKEIKKAVFEWICKRAYEEDEDNLMMSVFEVQGWFSNEYSFFDVVNAMECLAWEDLLEPASRPDSYILSDELKNAIKSSKIENLKRSQLESKVKQIEKNIF